MPYYAHLLGKLKHKRNTYSCSQQAEYHFSFYKLTKSQRRNNLKFRLRGKVGTFENFSEFLMYISVSNHRIYLRTTVLFFHENT
jgi:hypothetical protein